jgi:predicted nucleic acid-binding protein
MYLFDTDVLSNLVKRQPSPLLISKLETTPAELQYTSSINLGEMVYGAYRQTEQTARLLIRLEQAILPNVTILPFDATAARIYGEVRAALERMGTPIGDADTRIASVALARNFTVVAGNVRHFRRVPGLRVENWLA